MFTLNPNFSKKFQRAVLHLPFEVFFVLFWCPSAYSPFPEGQKQSHKPMSSWLESCMSGTGQREQSHHHSIMLTTTDEIHSTTKRISYRVRVREWATTAESLFVLGIDQCIFSIIWNIIPFRAVTVGNLFRTQNLQRKHGWILGENEQRQQLCAIPFVCIINVQH